MIPVSVYQGLATVQGLKAGRSAAIESPRVQPVPQEAIDAVFPYVSDQVRAMIQIQLLTAARPGEVVQMRPIDLDVTKDPWVYKLIDHKTAHHGYERVIFLGPKAQMVIMPFLNRNPDEYLFKPAEAEAARRMEQHRLRRTPIAYGNRPGSNRKKKGNQFRDRYL